MAKIYRGCWVSLVALFLGGTMAGRTQNPSPPVEARVVKYAGLIQEVLKHKGKVVVVDCWGIT